MRNNANDYTASLAGKKETWKEWAGRKEGGNGFYISDIYKHWKKKRRYKKICKRITTSTYHTTTTDANNHGDDGGLTQNMCPVCYTEIQKEEDWFVTKSCLHATCIDCTVEYLKSQIHDHGHDGGALKCAVCSEGLTEADTIKLFRYDEDLVHAWDTKMRDNALRKALENFRPCPNCEKHNEGGGGGSIRGGFVTAECLESIIADRCHYAEKKIEPWKRWIDRIIMITSFYIPCIDTDWSNIIIIFWIWSYRSTMLLDLLFAMYKQKIIIKPTIEVGCPCCERNFALNTEAELTNTTSTAANDKWIRKNSRPCPGCNSPIEKNEGCNHMTCAQCNTNFCWVCMRANTTCGSFSCDTDRSDTFQTNEGSRQSLPSNFSNQQAELDRCKRKAAGIFLLDYVVLSVFMTKCLGFSLKTWMWIYLALFTFALIGAFIACNVIIVTFLVTIINGLGLTYRRRNRN